jgi:hypothetical protein
VNRQTVINLALLAAVVLFAVLGLREYMTAQKPGAVVPVQAFGFPAMAIILWAGSGAGAVWLAVSHRQQITQALNAPPPVTTAAREKSLLFEQPGVSVRIVLNLSSAGDENTRKGVVAAVASALGVTAGVEAKNQPDTPAGG